MEKYEIKEELEEILGKLLVAYIADDEALQTAYNIYILLRDVEGDDTIRAWFVDMNTTLDYLSPVEALKGGKLAETQAAAYNFLAQ